MSKLLIYLRTSSPNHDTKFSEVPGPGLYKIPGFADILLREVDRILRNRKAPELPKVERKVVKKLEIMEEEEEF
jgi:hypothetical protein